LLPGLAVPLALAQQAFDPMEATIASIHTAISSRQATCVQVIQSFLDRIEAYNGILNAVQNVNPNALEEAAAVDRRFAATGQLQTLDCIPVALKDQIETNFMPTTYGSALFLNFTPERNATIVTRLMDAGAIIVAHTTMGEFAAGGSGSAFGDCHNAYNVLYHASGSSCGTGIAIAANFAVIGIGEDTVGSLRGPAAHGNLFGLRPTTGLISVFGVMPQEPSRDTLGPITRTVEDAAITLDVIAGYDVNNPITARSYGNIPETYTAALDPSLEGMRFGVIRVPMARNTDTAAATYLEIQSMLTAAVGDLASVGAEIIEAIAMPEGIAERIAALGYNFETEDATNAYLAQHPNAPVQTMRQMAESPLVIESARRRLSGQLDHSPVGDPAFAEALRLREELRLEILNIMAANDLDGLIYATFDAPPPPLPASAGSSNRNLASYLGLPAIAIPGGLNAEGLPIGIEIVGRQWGETTLLHAAYGYERSANHRVLPPTAPPLN
jgi:Asp-tRNA(Asn)/Glu-tRNA(Gln) amidotransferase A subunit family amidase